MSDLQRLLRLSRLPLWAAVIVVWVVGLTWFVQLDGDRLGVLGSIVFAVVFNPTASVFFGLGVTRKWLGAAPTALLLTSLSTLLLASKAVDVGWSGMSVSVLAHLYATPVLWFVPAALVDLRRRRADASCSDGRTAEEG